MSSEPQLSRREREIMDILHARGEATAVEVRAAMPSAPSYSAVRALLRILEEKGFARHRQDGARYIYLPCVSRETASRSALKRILDTFFGGSLDHAVAGLLDASDKKLSGAEFKKLQAIIQQAESKNGKGDKQ